VVRDCAGRSVTVMIGGEDGVIRYVYGLPRRVMVRCVGGEREMMACSEWCWSGGREVRVNEGRGVCLDVRGWG